MFSTAAKQQLLGRKAPFLDENLPRPNTYVSAAWDVVVLAMRGRADGTVQCLAQSPCRRLHEELEPLNGHIGGGAELFACDSAARPCDGR
jgi:hypothetical protein